VRPEADISDFPISGEPVETLEDAQALIAALQSENAELKARITDLEGAVEALRRGSKRQSAPFSKGDPKEEPARPGRKKGKAHGRHGHRMVPANPDRTLDAPLPERCPHCDGQVDFEHWDDQYQTELPEPRPVITHFRVGVGRCRGCKARLQGRHLEQSSDALGPRAPRSGPGPRRGRCGCTTAWA